MAKNKFTRDVPLPSSDGLFGGPGDPKKTKSDSLMRESNEKKLFAFQQEKIAKAQIKKDGGNKRIPIGGAEYGPSGNERMDIVRNARKSASSDSALAMKIKKSKKK
jgi:hypothetical protein